MCVICRATYAATAATLALKGLTSPVDIHSNGQLFTKIESRIQSLEKVPASLEKVKLQIKTPDWRKSIDDGSRPNSRENKRVVYYSVSTKGVVGSNLSEFSQQANQTLNDPRGWSRLGISFKQIESGGSFRLILSEARFLPSFSSGCSADWSCRVGPNVIINDNRWSQASASWNASGGNLRDYRHMVINHEVGHWLGHGHYNCSGANALAPVMQQQSIELQGCKHNPWPLNFELVSSSLGIDKRK